MATRLYLPDNADAYNPGVSPAFSSEWEKTSTADRRGVIVDKTGSRDTAFNTGLYGSENVTTSPYDVLVRQYITPPLVGAVTISGTVKGQLRVSESNAAADYCRAVVIKVVSRDGGTLRGTLLSHFPASLTSEFSTGLTNRYFPPSSSLSPVAAQAGDRIVIELGFRSFNTTTASYNGYLCVGCVDSLGDLPEDETTTTALNPWIEFSQDLQFEQRVGGLISSLVREADVQVGGLSALALQNALQMGGLSALALQNALQMGGLSSLVLGADLRLGGLMAGVINADLRMGGLACLVLDTDLRLGNVAVYLVAQPEWYDYGESSGIVTGDALQLEAGMVRQEFAIYYRPPLSVALEPRSTGQPLYGWHKLITQRAGRPSTVQAAIFVSARYNGAAPCLVVLPNPLAGILTETVVATYTGAAGQWSLFGGTLPAVPYDTVLELCLKVSGTAGTVYVSDLEVS